MSGERDADPDAGLVARCRRGDRAAFNALLARHRGHVVNLAYQMLGAADEAQDAAQDAFVKAFTQLKQFRGDAPFATWLKRIAVNECLTRLARRRAAADLTDDLPAPRGAMDEALALRAAIGSLSPPLRAALVLRELHGTSYEDIARILGIPLGTVRSRLAAARERLRAILGEEE
jgi:RNA polymerase sigma-70 factor (ECF subfamily)